MSCNIKPNADSERLAQAFGTDRETERRKKKEGIITSPNAKAGLCEKVKCLGCAFGVHVGVCERSPGAVKLYLYSVVMHSICGQRLHNAHITARGKERETRRRERLNGDHLRQKGHRRACSHLLDDSLPSGLPAQLFVVFHDPIFTVGRRRRK